MSDPYEDARAVGPASRAQLRLMDRLSGSKVRDEAPGGSARDDGAYVLADGFIATRRGREADLRSRAPTAAPKDVGQAGMNKVDPRVLQLIAAMMRK